MRGVSFEPQHDEPLPEAIDMRYRIIPGGATTTIELPFLSVICLLSDYHQSRISGENHQSQWFNSSGTVDSVCIELFSRNIPVHAKPFS